MMKNILLATAILFVLPLSAQQGKEISIKSTPASDALVKLSKDIGTNKKNLNDILQQARSSLDKQQSDMGTQIRNLQKEINDKLEQDKHYKPLLDQLKALNAQAQTVNDKANQEYQKIAGPIQQQVAAEQAQITGLIAIVKQENSLSENASYNQDTQKWVESPKPDEKPADPKKP